MKKLVLAGAAVAALALGSMTPAAAQGGCGPAGHRGFDGFCHPNFRPRPYGFYGYGYGPRFHRPYGYGFYGHGYGYGRPYRHW